MKGADRPAGGSIQNGPRRLKRIKALHWQTPARDSFDLQRLSGALANPIRHLLRLASADRPIVGTTSEPLLTFWTLTPLMIFFTRIRETDQIFAHIENKSADMESAMTFRKGCLASANAGARTTASHSSPLGLNR